jgi:hypothetical protein
LGQVLNQPQQPVHCEASTQGRKDAKMPWIDRLCVVITMLGLPALTFACLLLFAYVWLVTR